MGQGCRRDTPSCSWFREGVRERCYRIGQVSNTIEDSVSRTTRPAWQANLPYRAVSLGCRMPSNAVVRCRAEGMQVAGGRWQVAGWGRKPHHMTSCLVWQFSSPIERCSPSWRLRPLGHVCQPSFLNGQVSKAVERCADRRFRPLGSCLRLRRPSASARPDGHVGESHGTAAPAALQGSCFLERQVCSLVLNPAATRSNFVCCGWLIAVSRSTVQPPAVLGQGRQQRFLRLGGS